MRAVIYAAGKSTRLGDLTKHTPKSCLPISDQESILARSLKLLAKNGFAEVFIVTGFQEAQIKQECSKFRQDFKCLETIFNKEFATKNNYYSAHIAVNLLGDETLVLNSDIVYSDRILKTAVREMQRSTESFLVVDDSKKLIDEDMKVTVDKQSGRILRINKKLENDSAVGEYIGMLRLNNQDTLKFKRSLAEMLKANETDKYYEDALDRIIDSLDLYPLSTRGEEWTEIDFVEDYEKARQLKCIKQTYQQS